MDFLALLVAGVALGCVYALMASGVVLTYKTSAVFNLGLGAQAYASAAIFYTLTVDMGLPILVALIVSVFVLSPLLGLGLYWGLFRYTQGAPETVKLVVGLGVLLVLPALIQGVWFGTDLKGNPPVAVPGAEGVFELGGIRIGGDSLTTIFAALVVVVALAGLFKFTVLGLRMRAVVESPRMVQLAGINADGIASVSWMLSGFVAGLAGVMLAPLFGSVDVSKYTLLLVAAIAAAVVGRLSSLPWTLIGGLALGVTQVVLARYLPADSVLAEGLRPSLPFILLFGLLVFVPKYRTIGGVTDPLSGVDPPPKALRSRAAGDARAKHNTFGQALLISAGVVAFFALALSDVWLLRVTTAVVMSVILLSYTVLTGIAGQISLGQAAFAGAGAFTAAQLANRFDFPLFWGMLLGAAVASLIGVLLALPLRRLRGIYMTLATLAFGLMVDQIIFPLEAVGGSPAGLEVPRPYQHGWSGSLLDFSDDRAFFIFCCTILFGVGWYVWRLRDGSTGQVLDAIRGSETGAASVGIDPGRAKVKAFAVSAAIAGIGGVLLVSLQGRATSAEFSIAESLLWPVLIIVLGARSIPAAIFAGMFLTLLPEVLSMLGVPQPLAWVTVIFGLGAFIFIKNQEGLVDWVLRLMRDAGRGGKGAAPIGGAVPAVNAPPVIDLTPEPGEPVVQVGSQVALPTGPTAGGVAQAQRHAVAQATNHVPRDPAASGRRRRQRYRPWSPPRRYIQAPARPSPPEMQTSIEHLRRRDPTWQPADPGVYMQEQGPPRPPLRPEANGDGNSDWGPRSNGGDG